jgi:hypothetical protein
LGRIDKGIKCSVIGCNDEAIRSLPVDKVKSVGLKVGEARRSFLCKDHYKEFKKGTKKDRKLEKWRYGVPR